MCHHRPALGLAVIGFSDVGFLLQAPQLREFADGDQGRRRSTAVVADHDGLVTMRDPLDQLVELATGLSERIYLFHSQNVHMGEYVGSGDRVTLAPCVLVVPSDW